MQNSNILGKEHAFESEGDAIWKADFIPTDAPYDEQKYRNNVHIAYTVFRLNNLEAINGVLRVVMNSKAHERECFSTLEFAFRCKALAPEQPKAQNYAKKLPRRQFWE